MTVEDAISQASGCADRAPWAVVYLVVLLAVALLLWFWTRGK